MVKAKKENSNVRDMVKWNYEETSVNKGIP
jgi:hypothetical protein